MPIKYLCYSLVFSFLLNVENSFAQKQKNTAEFDANIPRQYTQLINTLIMKSGISPTSAARIHGYVGLSLYESVNAGSPTYQSIAKQLNGLETPPSPTLPLLWDVVADETMHAVSDSLFSYIYSTLADYNYIRKALDTLQLRNKISFKNRYRNPKLVEESVKFGNEDELDTAEHEEL